MEPDFIPVNEDLNVGIAPMVNQSLTLPTPGTVNMPTPGPVVLPDTKKVFSNIAKNAAIDYAGKKLGINQLGQVLSLGGSLGNVFGFGLNPLGIGIAALAGGIRNQYNNYRFGKAIAKESRKNLQERIDKGEFGSTTPTSQDQRRGGQYEDGRGMSANQSTGTSAERGAALHG